MALRIRYNSPVVLTLSIFAAVIYFLNAFTKDAITPVISVPAQFNTSSVSNYLGLVLYIFGHGSIDHLLGNLSLLLLLGPILEEKYGSGKIAFMIVFTAVITAVLNIVFFHNGLWGASGIVFMFILLVSFANSNQGDIPVTFILITALYVGREVYNAFQPDNISQFAHIAGGVAGSIFGFMLSDRDHRPEFQ